MGIAERAAGKGEGADRLRQLAIGDRGGGFRGVEGEDDVEFAVGELLLHVRVVLRVSLAFPPQERRQPVEIGKQGRGVGRESGFVDGFLQLGPVVYELDQHLLQEGRAGEVRRLRVGEAPGIGRGPFQEIRRGIGQLARLHARRVVEEHELGAAPGALQSVGGDGEIGQHSRHVFVVDIAPVRQFRRPAGRVKQPLAFHRGEVLAVDPHEIDRSALVLSCGFFREHGRGRLSGVVELHMDDGDAVARLHFIAGPSDIGIDVLGAAPGVEIDRLAARLRGDRLPVPSVRGGRPAGKAERQQRCGDDLPCPPDHDAPLPPPHAVAAEGKTRAVCVNARGRLLPSRFGETCSGRLFRGSGNGLPELGIRVTQGP